MTLENIYYVSQTLAVAAILASLIAIWRQQLQTNKIARADMTERVLGKLFSIMEIMTTDAALANHYAKLVKGQEPEDPAIAARLVWFFSLMLQSHNSSFFLWKDRLTDERSIGPHDQTILLHLKTPFFGAEWERVKKRRTYPEDYVKHVEALREKAGLIAEQAHGAAAGGADA